jgi:hypothetical protein
LKTLISLLLLAFPVLACADWMVVDDPLAAEIRPRHGATVEQTPPDFSWPEASNDARYSVTLTYPDGRKRTLPAPQNYINWDEALPAGTYSWTVTWNGRVSDARKFTVSTDARPFVLPPMKELAERIKAKPHPRGLPDQATLAQMASQRPAGVASLRAEVDNRIRAQLIPMPASGQSKDQWEVIDEVKRTVNALSAYVLTKDQKYYEESLRRLRLMASWDPNGPTAYTRQHMDKAARALTFALVLGYDWLHPKLSDGDRHQLRSVIRTRLGHIHGDVIGMRSRIAKHPRDSHGQLAATMLGMMSALMVGDIPEAESWMEKSLPLAASLTSPWGGEESGFSNGSAYGIWGTGELQPYWYVMRWATGVDFAQKAWVRNYGRFLAYFNPPGTPARLFGDGHEQAMLAEQSARFGKGYANFAPNPLNRWYASRLAGEAQLRLEYILSPPADFHGPQPLPAGTPNALHLQSIGWVAMHSDLADEKRVSVYFKSSPPPHGAFNHSHADQNSFVINAGGQRLAIESGYYDSYKSPHWLQWLKTTRAKNAITFDGGKGQIFFEQTGYKKMGYGRITRFETHADYDITSGDATPAYDGALSQAQRTLVYIRPNIVIVHDRLASANPRQWEWNIHALQKMRVESDRKIEIESGGQRLCVSMLGGPEVKFTQDDQWTAAPKKGDPQWHGRFSTSALPKAEFVALLNVGCTKATAKVDRDGDGWRVSAGEKTIRLD